MRSLLKGSQFTNSLRFRLLLLVLLCTLPALGLAVYTGVQQRRLAAEGVKNDALRVAQLAVNNQRALNEGARQLLIALARMPQVRLHDPQVCSQFLLELLAEYPIYTGISASLPNGDIYCSSNPSAERVNLADRDYFQEVLVTREFVIGSYSLGQLRQTTALPFAYPILTQDGEISGVLVVALDLEWVVRLASDLNLPENSSLLVIDQDGTILTRYPNPEEWIGRDPDEVPVISKILEHHAEGTTEAAGVDGIIRLNAFTPLFTQSIGQVYVNVGIPSDIAFAEVNRILNINLVWLLAVAGLAAATAWFISDAFVLRHIHSLVLASLRLGGGDLNARSQVPYNEGEIGQLAQAFDHMASTLQEREDQLSQAEARYRSLVERVPAVIYTASLDQPGEMIYISPQIEGLVGFTAEQWLSDKNLWGRQLHPLDHDRVMAEKKDVKRLGELRTEYRLLTSRGRSIWVRDEASLVRDEQENPLLLQGVLVEITDRKIAEAALKKYALQLERSNRELQDFAYIASHDLQEPLRKIQAFGERLQLKYSSHLGENGNFYVERMRSSAERMQNLINDLLTYSRVGTRGRPFTPTDLNAVLREVIGTLQVRIEETNGKVIVEDLPVIEADPVQMQQLFQNLIGNALKFHPKERTPLIRIYSKNLPSSSRVATSAVQIMVEDNGIGFDEKYLDRIFLPFQRLHSRGDYAGSGIGLAICRKIVERHGGSLTAKSTPGLGSTFIATIPLNQPDSEKGEAS